MAPLSPFSPSPLSTNIGPMLRFWSLEGEMLMKRNAVVATAFVAATFLAPAVANAAKIKVLCSNGLTAVMNDVVPKFEHITGHKVSIQFMGIALKHAIDAGEPFDLAISQPDVIGSLIKQQKIANGTSVDVARTGMGAMVRSGTAKPDISSVASFKRALLDAKSITYSSDTAAGAYIGTLIERLGLTEEVKSKTKLEVAAAVARLVADGEAELGFVVIPQILASGGVELVGPFPPELQKYFVLTGAISSDAKEFQAAHALLAFLTAPGMASVIKAKGMEPAI
jgi:molybdate transport system substrate-binding protein